MNLSYFKHYKAILFFLLNIAIFIFWEKYQWLRISYTGLCGVLFLTGFIQNLDELIKDLLINGEGNFLDKCFIAILLYVWVAFPFLAILHDIKGDEHYSPTFSFIVVSFTLWLLLQNKLKS